jgi:heme-degrading monooxygenase HmoA
MYAVIFRAEINELDQAYAEMATRMRNLAINKYGWVEFTAMTEGEQEIAISYRDDQEQIKVWKQDPEHRKAQKPGRSKWYRSYQVQVVEIK